MKGYTSASAPPTLHHIDNTRSWRVVRSRQPSLTQINTCQVLYFNIKKPSPRNINCCRGETARCFRLVLGLYLFIYSLRLFQFIGQIGGGTGY